VVQVHEFAYKSGPSRIKDKIRFNVTGFNIILITFAGLTETTVNDVSPLLPWNNIEAKLDQLIEVLDLGYL